MIEYITINSLKENLLRIIQFIHDFPIIIQTID